MLADTFPHLSAEGPLPGIAEVRPVEPLSAKQAFKAFAILATAR